VPPPLPVPLDIIILNCDHGSSQFQVKLRRFYSNLKNELTVSCQYSEIVMEYIYSVTYRKWRCYYVLCVTFRRVKLLQNIRVRLEIL
jgi:hypothetical protein